MRNTSPARPGAALGHPVAMAALLLWLVNDHLLKGVGPGALTGKLSDVACLVVVPLIPVTLVELWAARRGGAEDLRRVTLWIALGITGGVMVTINLFEPAAFAYRHGMGVLQWPLRALLIGVRDGQLATLAPVHLTMDASDLFTLPALLVPWWLCRRAARPRQHVVAAVAH